MSQEPEKEIEKQLRAHAEQRRAEAAAQLGTGPHPATRKLLHGEIGRTFGPAPVAQKTTKTWWSYWPGLVFAGGLAVVMLLVFVNQSAQEKLGSNKLAKMEQLAPALSPSAATAPTAPAATPPPAMERSLSLVPANTEARKDFGAAVAEPQAGTKSMTVQNPEPAAKLGGTVSRESVAQGGAGPVASKPLDRMEVAKADEAKPQLKVYANRSRQFEQTELRPTADTSKQSMDRDADRTAAMKDSAPRPLAAAAPAAPPPAPSASAKRMAVAAPASSAAPAVTTAQGFTMQSGVVALEQKQAAQRPVSHGAYFANQLVSTAENNEAPAPVAPGQPALRKNFQSPPRPAVLTQFQVEQNGNEVRFIDQDGSVYIGQMGGAADESATLAVAEKAADKKEAVKAKAAEAQYNLQDARRAGGLGGGAGQNVQSFHASGLNVTLNQNVIISGEFLNQPALAGKKQSPTNYSKSMAAPAEKSKAVLLPPTQIQGRVQIGDRQEIILNAVPVTK